MVGATPPPPHGTAATAHLHCVRARRLFETERMVAAPLKKSARFLDRANDPSLAACGWQDGVDPRPAAPRAAPSINPAGFGVTIILRRQLRPSDFGARRGCEGWRGCATCAPQPFATAGPVAPGGKRGSTTAGRSIGRRRVEVGFGSPE